MSPARSLLRLPPQPYSHPATSSYPRFAARKLARPSKPVPSSTRSYASTTSEAANAAASTTTKAKNDAQQMTSKASEGLTRVTSSAGSMVSRLGPALSRTLGGIGGRTGRLIGFVQGVSSFRWRPGYIGSRIAPAECSPSIAYRSGRTRASNHILLQGIERVVKNGIPGAEDVPTVSSLTLTA